MSIPKDRRFNRLHPCPICQGYDTQRRGAGSRCAGFISEDGDYAHCMRDELAGSIQQSEGSGTFAHRLHGPCKCGQQHGPDKPFTRPGPSLIFDNKEKAETNIDGPWIYFSDQELAELPYRVVRTNTPEGKTYRQEWYDPESKAWLPGRNGLPDRLYQAWELAERQPGDVVFIVEGEKAVELLRGLKLFATCNVGGAGKWREHFNPAFKDLNVVILPDNDKVGRLHAETIRTNLEGIARTVSTLDLPGLPEKGDAYDYYKEHGYVKAREDIKALATELIAAAQPTEAEEEEQTCFHASELSNIPPVKWLLQPYLQDVALNLFSGESGAGKTFMALNWAMEVSRNDNVLYIACEDPTQYRERVSAWLSYHGQPEVNFWLETARLHLLEPATVDKLITKHQHLAPRLVVIDTYHAATEGSQENDNGQIGLVLGQLRRVVAEFKCAVLIVHHFDKGGNWERGGSALKAGCVQALRLFVEGDGVRLTFDKARNAQKTTDQFYKWEPVEVDIIDRSTGLVETRTSRLPLKTDTAPLDKRKLSQQQMAVLQWLGAELRASEEHSRQEIVLGSGFAERTIGDILSKLKMLGLVKQGHKKGPYQIEPQGAEVLKTGFLYVAPLF